MGTVAPFIHLFVALEVGSRRLVHVNVTSHPTAAWILQQFREVLAAPHAYRFVLHDRQYLLALARRCRRRNGCPGSPHPGPGANGERVL
jgi:hypothetical protein